VAAVLAMASFACSAGADDIPAVLRERVGEVFAATRDGLWERNDVFWHQGEFERCITTLRLITELDPHDTEAFSNGSWLMWNQNRSDEAEVFLRTGLSLNRDVDDLYFDLGFFLYRASRFEEAVDYLEEAVTLPTHWRTWHLLAHAYEHAGDPNAALSIWFAMEATYPDSPVPQIQIDRILSGGAPPKP